MISWIPHTYIILYRAIYLIPVYICITGATYIHTKNKAGDNRLQHHGSGKTSVIDIHSHGPNLGCGLFSPPATPPAPKLCSAGLLGEGGRERKGCMPQLLGKGWAEAARGTGFSAARGAHHTSSRTINPCRRRNKGDSILSISPSHPQLQPWSLVPPGEGAHSLCQWCGTFWNV